VHCDEYLTWKPGWQTEIVRDHNHEYAVMTQGSVVLMAANWAWLHGAKDLALIGVDYRPGRAEMIPPYDSTGHRWADQYDKPAPTIVGGQFERALKVVTEHGGRMVNLSTGSRLAVVPMADAMEWLAEAS
jgi:hypothetical protein